MGFDEEDYIQISGIQHFVFCRRQWALIHIENQWSENVLTAEGRLMHKNVHNPSFKVYKDNVIQRNAVRIHSSVLGLSGECDVVELHRDEAGIDIPKYGGLWRLFPIEYKRGTKKSDLSDKAQLCAQAICLEEMFCCEKNNIVYLIIIAVK